MPGDTLKSAQLRVVFTGSAAFAVPSLEALKRHPQVDLVTVYTQPDRPAGRGRKLRPTAVKEAALAHALPVVEPESLQRAAEVEALAAYAPDVLVVAAYGLILPPAVLATPRIATINVHASLLPRWRGAAPIQRAIMAGDNETGITIMKVVEALDAGPMLLQRACPIEAAQTGGELEATLAQLGASCLLRYFDLLNADKLVETPQDPSLVSYAHKITKHDRIVDWYANSTTIVAQIRALNPAPLAQTQLGNIQTNILVAHNTIAPHSYLPGSLVRDDRNTISIATPDGFVHITELQVAGKRATSAAHFLHGYGQRLAFVD